MGADVVVQAAIDAGAKFFFGYPITPATEILSGWVKAAEKNSALRYLQAEDETAAGFLVNGALLGNVPAFTATAGVGNVLMQDGISMAEAMRLPFVGVIVQRGGPSTGTVIYSQQELNLTCFGGNGEGLRIVYSPSDIAELYEFTIRAFENAWSYRFPSFVLTDGYTSKTQTNAPIQQRKGQIRVKNFAPQPWGSVNLRNCYSTEEELAEVLNRAIADFGRLGQSVAATELYQTEDAEIVILAHGTVGSAAREAVDILRQAGKKVGLFRPKTLRPFPVKDFEKIKNKKLIVVESAHGQFKALIRRYFVVEMAEFFKPAEGITPQQIVAEISRRSPVSGSRPQASGQNPNSKIQKTLSIIH